jgi:signal transduction histidine kinase
MATREKPMSAVLRPSQSLRRSAPYGVAVLAVAVASWLEVLIVGSEASQLSLVPLTLAVVLSVWHGGLGPGLLALVLSALAADLLVIEPGAVLRFGSAPAIVVYAAFLAGGLIVCLAGARAFRRQQRERESSLKARLAAAQADRSAQLAVALSQARTPGAAIEAALQEPLHALRADAAAMFLITGDGTTAEVARAVAYGPDAAPPAVSLLDRTPVGDAVGRGAAVILESAAAREQEYGGSPGARYAATAAIPLLIGSRAVAVAQFDFEAPRGFSDSDREYLEAFAIRAAAALDRTWQYEDAVRARAEAEAQRARADQEIAERQNMEVALRASEARGRALAARTSRLHGLTAALSESVTLDAVARAVVQQGRVAVGATSGEVTLLVNDGQTFHTLFAEGGGLISTDESALDGGSCATEAVRTGRAIYISSFEEWQQRYPMSASRAADGGYISSATVPLLVKSAPIGVLAFHFTAPVNFDDEYRALLVSVAQDCAQALDRARLYESAQLARAEAEAANRLKDEFVSIVSHELRSPLNAILGWTSMLLRGAVEPALASRALQSVHDNATRQARLIEELLDFSRVASGRLPLVREEIDVRDLLRGVVEALIPDTVAKGVSLELAPVPPARVFGDLRRLEQVFFNLLGNALKFTPPAGRIMVSVQRQEAAIEVQVTDTGRGIEPEFLPFVFDRFRQGDSTASRDQGGLGLGLSIARQLVEAHDGRIRVDSAGTGHGATFSVTLPVASPASGQPEPALMR